MNVRRRATVPMCVLAAVLVLSGAACSSDKGGQDSGTPTTPSAGNTAAQSQRTSPARPPSGSASSGSASSGSASSGSASSGSGEGLTVPTAVLRVKGGVAMYVPVTIHGKKYYFDLDSGASSTIIDSTVAKSIGLKSVGSAGTLTTIGCKSKAGLVRIDNWALGSKKLPSGKLVSRDAGFAKLKVKGVQVAGLLGADFQAGAGTVRADFKNEEVTFGGPVTAGGKSVELKILKEKGGGIALVAPVTVGGAKIPMLVDTGASKTTISTSVARQLRLPHAGKPVKVNAVGCAATVQPVTLAGAKVGDVSLPRIVAVSSANGAPLKAVAGLLGADALSAFGSLTLDYKNSMMSLGG